MTEQPFRLAAGGRIDRSKPVSFRFAGRRYGGFIGDTLASALLANGVHLVGRSIKYHRPRGVFTAGEDEPSAIVEVAPGRPHAEPNTRATEVELYDGLHARPQNVWPRLGFDIGRAAEVFSPLLPAGFYYKTFMGRGRAWRRVESLIRAAAGLGRAPEHTDPDIYDHIHAHCDVLVVGGGPVGLAAALAAARAGGRVVLVERDFAPGGGLLAERPEATAIDDLDAGAWVARAEAELAALPHVTILTRATAFGYYADNMVTVAERLTDHLAPGVILSGIARQRLWKIRARRVVLATGAIERPLVFEGNDRPGILLAGAARRYANRFAARPGSTAVVLTANDTAYRTALDLHAAGVRIAAIVDVRDTADGDPVRRAEAAGLPVLRRHAVVATEGGRRLSAVHVARLTGTGRLDEQWRPTVIACDTLCVSGGWSPALHLFAQSGGKPVYDQAVGAFVPGRPVQAERSVGAAAGVFGLRDGLADGHAAGVEAAAEAGHIGPAGSPPHAQDQHLSAPLTIWRIPRPPRGAPRAKAFVDLQTDVTVDDLALAVREGYGAIEHVKRYTTTGMGTDQGKTGNLAALGIVAETVGRPVPEVGTTTFRPPYTPVAMGTLAGRFSGSRFAPQRNTPIDRWHAGHGAVFEDVGVWRRPRYYPQPGEDMAAAVRREALAARGSVAVLDASTLGKIDIQGPDAAEFLNRVYTNRWDTLPLGRCRYGLMLGDDGMVMDDGVTARLAGRHFHMTTTTGGAGRVHVWLEEWLQTEWPDLRVFLTPVTEQWAVVSLIGPDSRRVLAGLVEDIDVSADGLPPMAARFGRIGGVPARVFRVCYAGGLGFEVNVPASYGLAVWEAVMDAGRGHAVTPLGTEAMHLLRAEAGFIAVGQDTDGTVTPMDLGLETLVARDKPDFIGKRSLQLPALNRPDRKHLVGLQPLDPQHVPEEGAPVVEREVLPPPPVPMLGHVTSAYFSPLAGRSIALALVAAGRRRLGETVWIAATDRTFAARVVPPGIPEMAGGGHG